MNYADFIDCKSSLSGDHGFTPEFFPEATFDFQRALIEWAVRKGRAAIFADCGLGKTLMELAFAENVVRKTNRPVLLLTPLAVGAQTVREGHKFGVDAVRSLDGTITGARVVVANYERLHYFNPEDFAGVVCDESSILKNFDGATRQAITVFMRKIRYRLLCTATAAPNDYVELGTSSEALGYLGFQDMLGKFFKKTEATMRRSQENRHGLYRFRGHAERDFWRWVCSWARAIRKPSDMGFDDGSMKLPPLITRQHVITPKEATDGFLFTMPAHGLQEQRSERSRTTAERVAKAAQLVEGYADPVVAWCHLNSESAALARAIPGAVEVSGADPDEAKEEKFAAFESGEIRAMVTKPSIAGFGLNWQHCARQTFFPSHSFEQWYQAIRRSWRFGQTRSVEVDVITTEGERNVLANFNRKAEQAEKMFEQLVAMMNDELTLKKSRKTQTQTTIPTWL